MLAAIAFLALHRPSVLEVGDGKPFVRIEDAVKSAHPGDEIDVYPKSGGYTGTAVSINVSGITIKGIGGKVRLDGADFEYSGVGSVPRAIFQIDKYSNGVTIENFELCGAHNKSFNGAGVRINQANRATIRDCDIHGNDMGIMSNGMEGDAHLAEDQLIDHCSIHHNGNLSDPGFNHNLYLGGTSVTVQFCTIDHALTGHNLKCRAHFALVKHCHIFASANRELDFVEAWDTDRPNSNVVLVGNVIEKDPDCKGNRVVINFGVEHARRDGKIYLINNTIHTPFQSAVLALNSPTVGARFTNNVIYNPSQAHPVLVSFRDSASTSNVDAHSNALSPNYSPEFLSHGSATWLTTTKPDEQLTNLPEKANYIDGEGNRQPAEIKYRFTRPNTWKPSKATFVGAG